jgi:glycerophosphoryl diester phosphodiesterase
MLESHMSYFLRTILVMGIFVGLSSNAVEFIAHRGASFDAPENTVASMRLGFEQKADAGELDIHLTKDQRILVIHDFDTARVSGISNVVAESSSADLRALSAGQWGKWRGSQFQEKIPLLENALETVPAGKRIFIEIKCGPEVLPELERVLSESKLEKKQLVIIGFGYSTVTKAKKRLPDVPVFWLAGADKNKKYPPLEELIAKAKAANLDGLNLEKGFPMDRAFVEKVHAAGLKLYVWTVGDPELAKRLVAAGIDGITTNRPQWLREALAKDSQ